jgi:hypothetical protein
MLGYNFANFMRTLSRPQSVEHGSLRRLALGSPGAFRFFRGRFSVPGRLPSAQDSVAECPASPTACFMIRLVEAGTAFVNDWIKGEILGSLRNMVTQEVRKHGKTNAAFLQNRTSFAIKWLHFFFSGCGILTFLVWYVASILLSFLIEVGFKITYLSFVFPGADDPNVSSFLKDLTSYFLGAQTVMIGLLFPIAVGLVTLIVQREGASSTIADVQVYYSESLAYGIGASGIALSIVLAFQLAWQFMAHLLEFENAGQLSTFLLTLIHLVWLTINFMGLWHFLAVSLSFVRPGKRAQLRRRFATNVSIPEDLFDRLFEQTYRNAIASVLPGSDEFGEQGDVEIADPKLSGKFMYDVWMNPLRWAARRWRKRCDRQSSSSHQSASDPTLVFTAGPRRALPEGGILCRRKSGVPLSSFEKFVIRRCFRLKRARS